MVRNKLLYIHGLGSNENSRKYQILKSYFELTLESSCLEWENDDSISMLLDKAENNLKGCENPVIIGDSTGANFAYQLRERRVAKNQNSILILTSPLLNFEKRITIIDFPENIKNQLIPILNPTKALIIATADDESIDQNWLFEELLENISLIKVDDNHRLMNFKDSLPAVQMYIFSQTK